MECLKVPSKTDLLLNCPMNPKKNDAGVTTVKRYLKKLLVTLFEQGEGFSGKRPFGNSCWEYEVWAVWIKEGLMPGTLDGEGYIQEYDSEGFYKQMYKCINSL